jgi:hypothetical protein
MKMEQSVPKRRHIKFRRRGITQKKAYNIVSKCLGSSEIWCWRWMEKVSWADCVRREEELQRVELERNIIHTYSKNMED